MQDAGYGLPRISLLGNRVNKGESRTGAKAALSAISSATTISAEKASTTVTPVAPTAAGMVIRVGLAGLIIAWPTDPDHQHCEERRHSRHEDATEDQNPAQRNTRPEGQDNSEGRVGDEKPDEVPHELLARPLRKMHSPRGHRLTLSFLVGHVPALK
jgi:hypothetical protein